MGPAIFQVSSGGAEVAGPVIRGQHAQKALYIWWGTGEWM